MRHNMKLLAAAGLAMGLGTSAGAATLESVSAAEPTLSASGGEASFFPGFTPGSFDVLSFTPETVSSTTGALSSDPTGFELNYNLSSLGSGLTTPTGFDISDPSTGDVFLAADAIEDFSSSEGELQILFSGLSGSAAGDFDTGAIFGLEPVDTAGNSLGSDPLAGFATLSAGDSVFADSLTVSNATTSTDTPAPIPLPAALPVFLVGLGGLGYAGRRKCK